MWALNLQVKKWGPGEPGKVGTRTGGLKAFGPIPAVSEAFLAGCFWVIPEVTHEASSLVLLGHCRDVSLAPGHVVSFLLLAACANINVCPPSVGPGGLVMDTLHSLCLRTKRNSTGWHGVRVCHPRTQRAKAWGLPKVQGQSGYIGDTMPARAETLSQTKPLRKIQPSPQTKAYIREMVHS